MSASVAFIRFRRLMLFATALCIVEEAYHDPFALKARLCMIAPEIAFVFSCCT